jgi:hypothetical protein
MNMFKVELKGTINLNSNRFKFDGIRKQAGVQRIQGKQP